MAGANTCETTNDVDERSKAQEWFDGWQEWGLNDGWCKLGGWRDEGMDRWIDRRTGGWLDDQGKSSLLNRRLYTCKYITFWLANGLRLKQINMDGWIDGQIVKGGMDSQRNRRVGTDLDKCFDERRFTRGLIADQID